MPLRAAVIGAGTVSDHHLSALDQCPRTELVAVCDIDENRARTVGNEYGIDYFTDVEDLVASETLDWVHLCTSVQSHLELAKIFIEAGIPIMIEKPITERLNEVEEIISLSERHDVPVSSVHQHVFDPVVRRARRLIDDGTVGQVRGVDTIFTGETEPDIAQRGSWAFDLAGGEFEEGLPHPLYLTLNLGGYPADVDRISAVTSLVGTYAQDFDYDNAQVQYVTRDGAICSTKILSNEVPQSIVHVHGTKQSLTLDLVSQSLEKVKPQYDGSNVAKVRNSVGRILGRGRGLIENGRLVAEGLYNDDWETLARIDPHYAQIDAEAKALQTGAPLPVPIEEAKWTIALQEAIRASAESEHAEIAISEQHDSPDPAS